jgi:hypothetical protein
MANNANRFNFDENDRSANSMKPLGHYGDKPSDEFYAFVESLTTTNLRRYGKQLLVSRWSPYKPYFGFIKFALYIAAPS